MYTVEFSYAFRYRPLPAVTVVGSLPVLEIILRRNEVECPVLALIDTGATFSLFSADLADALGISLFDGRPESLATLGGDLAGYAHNVEVEIAYGWSLGSVEVLFADRNLPRNLIGRSDLLLNVVLGLSERTETIYLLPAEQS